MFEIHQKHIAHFQSFSQNTLRHKGASIKRRVNTRLPDFAEQCQRKLFLHQRLPTGHRYAAAGFLIKIPVFQGKLQGFCHRGFPAVTLHGSAGAKAFAFSADMAQLYLKTVFAKLHALRPGRAMFHAGAAVAAKIAVTPHLGTGYGAFRVMAPQAPQGAPLGEKCGADPRTVMDGEAFGIKQDAGDIHVIPGYFWPAGYRHPARAWQVPQNGRSIRRHGSAEKRIFPDFSGRLPVRLHQKY